MSDYGFATYDKGGKKRTGSVNSKWPIFGPKYSDIKRAFRTIHFTDTTSYAVREDPNVTLPSATRSAISQRHNYNRVLIATIPHGYSFRPIGYATISGSFVKNTRSRWIYTNYADPYSTFPPSATLNQTDVLTGNMLSTIGGGLRPTGTNYTAFEDNYYSQFTYPSGVYYYLTQNYFLIPGNNSTQSDAFGTDRPPYGIEIDDTNVYVYRYYYWCDVYKRDYYTYNGTLQWDVRARMLGMIDYAGSDFDVTIYLCPYRMEDLV